ncbi:MAG: hypothetical protein ACREMP_09700 [Candidatus Tyrphobacter sp.]
MGDSDLQHAFAFAPWGIFIIILIVAFIMARGEKRHQASAGQTFACASCGRRGPQGHMITVSHEGAESWYCGECAASLHSQAS